MPAYSLHHIHHEAADVPAAVEFYESVFGATSEEPFMRDGSPWVFVHIGDVQITVTGREAADSELHRYKGLDHVGLATDDFDATMARIEELGVSIWFGPKNTAPNRIVFIDGPDNVKVELVEKQ